MFFLYYYTFFSNHRLTGDAILFGMTGWREDTMQQTKENLQPSNWLQNEKLKSSHCYADENKPNLISIYPASLCSSGIAQADRISVANVT